MHSSRRLLAPLLLALLSACGGDEEAQNPAPVPGSGGSGGAAGAATGGGTSAGGSSGTAGGGKGGAGGMLAGTPGPLGTRDDLPIDETVSIDNLTTPVDVVRDKWGRPHIYATNAADAMRVEGYLVAKDRSVQLDLLRRAAEGRLAEALGDVSPSLIDVDISYRTIGLARVAKLEYDALAPDSETKLLLDAYADGVTQAFHAIKANRIPVPGVILQVFSGGFDDWTAIDTLAIGRLQTHLLSFDADVDLGNQELFDHLRGSFSATASDPLAKKRAGLERDLFRFAPGDAATTTTGYPMAQSKHAKPPKTTKKHPPIEHGFLDGLKAGRDMFAPRGFGSNNWAIAGSHSASGHAMVASDPHLQLSAPAIFWPVSIDVTAPAGGDATKDLHLGGIAFPGIPGIILGHNANIGWGATVAGYDVSDVYAETLSSDGKSVTFKGAPVALQEVDEVIKIAGQPDYTYKVLIVPHHGPISPSIRADHTVADPDPTQGAISIRWTGLEPTGEVSAVFGLMRAKNVDEARSALNEFGVGAQNFMIGDSNGDILWTSHARVPIRDKKAFTWDAATYEGTLPCFLLPGDGSAEWTGFLPDDLVPWQKNPAAGYISTANNDPIGNTLDNDPSNDTLPDGTPQYLACSYDIGFREGRIHARLDAHPGPLTADDLSSIQGDARAPLGVQLVPDLLSAIADAEAERATPGTHPSLTAVVTDPAYDSAKVLAAKAALEAWRDESDFLSHEGVDLDTNAPLPDGPEARASAATLLFHTWFVRVVRLTVGDELDVAKSGLGDQDAAKAILHLFHDDPKKSATYDAATGESALWDDLTTPAVIESKDERSIRALLSALAFLDAKAGGLSSARWGQLHTLTFAPLASPLSTLQIPPSSDPIFGKGFPRHGASFTVDVANFGLYVPVAQDPDFTYGEGPTQRFVVELDPAGAKARNALPGGEIADPKSPHFRDEAELWRKNQTHPVPFALDDLIAVKESRSAFNATK